MPLDGILPFGPLQCSLHPFKNQKIFTQTLVSDTKIRRDVCKSLVLNAVALLSIYFFDLMLQPIVREHQQRRFHRNIGWFYQVMWLLPVLGVSLYLNVRFL